jgi:hypothetical protein
MERVQRNKTTKDILDGSVVEELKRAYLCAVGDEQGLTLMMPHGKKKHKNTGEMTSIAGFVLGIDLMTAPRKVQEMVFALALELCETDEAKAEVMAMIRTTGLLSN